MLRLFLLRPFGSSRHLRFHQGVSACRLAAWALLLLAGAACARDVAYLAPNTGRPARSGSAREKLARVASYRRILWVTRWDFKTPEDVQKIFYNAASARFTDVLFQVRGEGAVFYRSRIEPWAWELTSDSPESTGRDPGWDPLATAVREGHRWGLRVHAYMNVLPGWAQKTDPPESVHQLYNDHRGWFMTSRGGRRMDPANWYAFLDPGLPEVRKYLASVFAEVARNYNVDGIHLDYIRYPEEQGDFSYNRRVVEAFEEEANETPAGAPDAWNRFRRRQVTACVRAISEAARAERPDIEISAAVVADSNRRENECFQPALDWVHLGLVDYLAPMAYTGDGGRFSDYCDTFGDSSIRKHVWMGVTADPNLSSQLTRQISRAAARGFGGVAVFSYENLFAGHRALPKARGVYEAFVRK